MQAGRVLGPMRRPCRRADGKRPVSRPALWKRIKAEFGYDSRRGVGACDRGPSGLGRRRGGSRNTSDDQGWV